MKLSILLVLALLCSLSACQNDKAPIVDVSFTDSLINHYQPSFIEKTLAGDSSFWKKQLDTTKGNTTALLQYSSDLIQRFHFYGEIGDLKKADSILILINKNEKETNAGVLRSLSALKITEHRFKEAEQYAMKAMAIGSGKYASMLLYFDATLELGEYPSALSALKFCKATNKYGYFFRMSKWMHREGQIDSAVYYMLKAADWFGNSIVLQQSALSNTADLYVHDGKLKKAYQLYVKNIRANAADYHSLQGIGRIALLYDHNIKAAEKIFRFFETKYKLPDALYNLEWLAEQKNDSALQKKYAGAFADKANDSLYGNMYNKYLIEFYSGVLNLPVKALAIAERELANRTTPQAYVWYVWCLHLNKQDDKAMTIYEKQVSGQPLEALELYYMGKLMKDMGKGYNAQQFFKAAEKNKYDLSPLQQKELSKLLE